MKVSDVMTVDVVTVAPDTGLKAAARKMVENGVSGLPVVDTDGKLVGIITEADFVQQEAGRSQFRYRRLLDAVFGERETRPQGDTVADAMTRQPLVIDENARLAEAAREMSDRAVKRLPVVDGNNHLLGIVSRADIVAAYVRPDDVIEDQNRHDVIERILMIEGHELDVEVEEGVVRVAGTVPTRTDARLLEELVGRLEGVIRVEGDLEWRVDDTVSPDMPPVM